MRSRLTSTFTTNKSTLLLHLGSLFFSVTAVFAEFERNLIAERVKSGIANARNKKPNKSWGRKSNLTQETASEIVRLHKEEGVGKVRLSKQFAVSVQTVYKVLNAA